jgi:hypothetical protein
METPSLLVIWWAKSPYMEIVRIQKTTTAFGGGQVAARSRNIPGTGRS